MEIREWNYLPFRFFLRLPFEPAASTGIGIGPTSSSSLSSWIWSLFWTGSSPFRGRFPRTEGSFSESDMERTKLELKWSEQSTRISATILLIRVLSSLLEPHNKLKLICPLIWRCHLQELQISQHRRRQLLSTALQLTPAMEASLSPNWRAWSLLSRSEHRLPLATLILMMVCIAGDSKYPTRPGK